MDIKKILLPGNNIGTPAVRPMNFNDEILWGTDVVSLYDNSYSDPFMANSEQLRKMASIEDLRRPVEFNFETPDTGTLGVIGSNDPLTDALDLQKLVVDTLNRKQLEKQAALKERQLHNKSEDDGIGKEKDREAQQDLTELRRLDDKFDNMWRNDLGGDGDLSYGSQSKAKLSDMEYKKQAALEVHNSNIESLESDKSNLESQLATCTDESEKQSIRDKISDVEYKLEVEKAKKEETQRQEAEKISQKKQKFQELRDKLYKIKEEVRLYKQDLENAGSYNSTNSWKYDVQWKLNELKYEEATIEHEMNTLISQ